MHILRSATIFNNPMKKLILLIIQKGNISNAFKGLQRNIAFCFQKKHYNIRVSKTIIVYTSIDYIPTHVRSYQL
jgi:hypothetical protein